MEMNALLYSSLDVHVCRTVGVYGSAIDLSQGLRGHSDPGKKVSLRLDQLFFLSVFPTTADLSNTVVSSRKKRERRTIFIVLRGDIFYRKLCSQINLDTA